jgi:hypothetical protein
MTQRTAQAKDLEARLDAQTKRTKEAVAKADAARNALKASAIAVAALEAQLAGLQVRLCSYMAHFKTRLTERCTSLNLLVVCQAAAAAQVASAATLAEQAASALSSSAAVRKTLVAC